MSFKDRRVVHSAGNNVPTTTEITQADLSSATTIPTDGNTFDELKEAVERFTDYVVMHPKQKFMLTAIGCGTAGYGVRQIAPLFRQAYSFGNVYVPAQFLSFMEKNPNI